MDLYLTTVSAVGAVTVVFALVHRAERAEEKKTARSAVSPAHDATPDAKASVHEQFFYGGSTVPEKEMLTGRIAPSMVTPSRELFVGKVVRSEGKVMDAIAGQGVIVVPPEAIKDYYLKLGQQEGRIIVAGSETSTGQSDASSSSTTRS